jgi:hypothetical protein
MPDPITSAELALGLGEVVLGAVQVLQGGNGGSPGTPGSINWHSTKASYPAGLEHVTGTVDNDVDNVASFYLRVDDRLAEELEHVPGDGAMFALFVLAGTFSGMDQDPVAGWASHEGDRRYVVANRYMANALIRLSDQRVCDGCSIDFDAAFLETPYFPLDNPSICCHLRGDVTIWGWSFSYDAFLYVYADGQTAIQNIELIGTPDPLRPDRMPWKRSGTLDAIDVDRMTWQAAAAAGKLRVTTELGGWQLAGEGLSLIINVGHEDPSFEPGY